MLLLLGARAVAASFDCAAARPQGPPCYPSHSGPHRIRRRLALKYRLAELKGVVLSLSRIYQSPKQLLIEVNRIISANIDPRSFITMTYAVLDLEAGTFTYARAGIRPSSTCRRVTPGSARRRS